MKQELIIGILGTLPISDYLLGFFFVLLAISLKWMWSTINGVKRNKKTPNKFSGKYWIQNNLKIKILSSLSNIISVYLIFRFSNELIGEKYSYIAALGIGFMLDSYIHKIQSKFKQ